MHAAVTGSRGQPLEKAMTADGTKTLTFPFKMVTNSTLERSVRICPILTLIAMCVHINTNTQRHAAGLQH